MSRPPCRALAEERSALVDGSLPEPRRERLLVHLVHCTGCRDDVAELRRLRATLRDRPAQEAPATLAQRLVLIAGEDARAPLWCRPFRRARPGRVTSRRRARRLRATAAAVAVGTTVVGAGALGYLAAPPPALAAVDDPGVRAQADLGATLAQLPLADQAVGALVSADLADLPRPAPVAGRAPATTGSRPLAAGQAADVLRRAVDAAGRVGYTGISDVSARTETGTVRAAVAVRSVPGQGSTAEVLDETGATVATTSAPAASPSRIADDTAVQLLSTHYGLDGWSDASAAGRDAALVQATRSDGSVAARWWVDDETGLLLAQQTFDAAGQPLRSTGFATLQLDARSTLYPPLQATVQVAATTTGLTLANAPVLSGAGWTCDDELAGLALVRLRSDRATTPGAVHLTYSDGVATLSVHEQRGVLARGPEGASWDTRLGAWTRSGASNLASWQSGDRVFTVATDGPPSLLAAAVASLPHAAPHDRTTMERIREGWSTMLADTKG